MLQLKHMGFKEFLKSQRKNYFINSRFQLKYSILLAALGTFLSLIIAIAIIYFLNETLEIFSVAGLGTIPTLMEILSERMNKLVITISFVFAIQVVCLMLIGIYSTHKICGPIYVLERSLKKIIRGIYTEKMALRKSDDFQSVPKIFNRMVDKLQTKLHEDIVFLQLVETEIEDFTHNNRLPAELIERANKLKNQAKFLREQKNYSLK